MIELAAELDRFLGVGIWAISLIFLRVGAALALLPAFGERVTPLRVKLAAALAFTMIVAPMIWPTYEAALEQRAWATLATIEVIAGLLIGALFRLLVMILQIAGTVAAQSTSLSQMFGAGLGAEPQPAISTLLFVAGLCLTVMAGLHIRVVEVFVASVDLFPPGVAISSLDVMTWGVAFVSQAFNLGVSLAAPFVLAAFIYNLALGAINRAMPQLMVAFVGAPAISLGGLVLLLIIAPILLTLWLTIFLQQTDPAGGLFR